MKSSWIETILDNIAELTVGYVGTMADEYVKTGVPFLRSLNVEPYFINTKDIKYIPEEFANKLQKSQLQSGDVVIVRTGKPGTCAVIPDELSSANCSDLVIVRPNKQKVNPLFLASFINTIASNQIDASIVGAVQQHFNVASAKKIQIFLPDINIQNWIAEIVGTINTKIKLNTEHVEVLIDTINALFKRWFNDFDYPNATKELKNSIPKGWVHSNVFERVIEVKEKNKDSNDYPVLSVVKEGEFKLSKDVFTKQVYSKSTANYKIVKQNQVAYNPARANIGSIAMLTDLEVGLVSPIYIVFEMKESITPTFFYYYMKQPIFLENIKHHAIGTTRQNFPFEAFKMFDIVVPPLELQLRFEEISRPIEQKIAKLKEESAVLAEIRDTILPKLMNGELPVEVGEE